MSEIPPLRYDWQRRAPTVRSAVTCGGERHEVLWRRGAIATAQHDLAAEEAMAALGGTVPACVQVVWHWRAAMVATAPTPWVYFGPRSGKRRLTAHVRPQGDAALPEPLRRTRLLTLRLPGSLSRDHGGELQARALECLEPVLPRRAAIAVFPGDDGPGIGRYHGRPLLVLPLRWLTHVWARCIEVVDGSFVADAAGRPGRDGLVQVVVLGWNEGEPSLEVRRLAPERAGPSPGAGRA